MPKVCEDAIGVLRVRCYRGAEEYVAGFDIPMTYASSFAIATFRIEALVQERERRGHLLIHLPNKRFGQVSIMVPVLIDQLMQVASGAVLKKIQRPLRSVRLEGLQTDNVIVAF